MALDSIPLKLFPPDNPQAPSHSSHSSPNSFENDQVSKEEEVDFETHSHVSGATAADDIKSLITVSKRQIYKSSQAKHPLAFRKEQKRLTPSAIKIKPVS